MRSATTACSPRGCRPSSRRPSMSAAVRATGTSCWSSARVTSTGRSRSLDKDVALSKYTTIGTGGPARWFTTPETIDELREALRWARDEGVGVETIGLGSNLLVHDDGVDALVLKLAGELA